MKRLSFSHFDHPGVSKRLLQLPDEGVDGSGSVSESGSGTGSGVVATTGRS